MMEKTKCVLGIDVGGTKICYGLITPDGEVLAYNKYETENLTAAEWTRRLISELSPFLDENGGNRSLVAIGLGVRGSVDYKKQRLQTSSVILNAAEYDICGELSRKYGVPAYMDNDVKAVALYELLYGVGREKNTFACINVGTGLAMGLVMDGVLIRGCHNNAGEIGNVLYERLDDGEIDFIEAVASGRGLDQERTRLEKKFEKVSCQGNGKALIDACKSGNPIAERVVAHMVRRLALLLLNLESSLDIGTYILTGGVMSDDWVREKLLSEILKISMQKQQVFFRWNAKIILPKVGTNIAGLCGAASVAYYELRKHEKSIVFVE